MLIVPVGKLRLQVEERGEEEEYRNGFIEQMKKGVKEVVKRCIEAELEAEETQILERERHRRRKRIKERGESGAYCQRCGSRKVSQFQRNGHYQRGLDTSWGHIEIDMPQVRCECGGSVRMPYRIIRRRQRIWDDLEWEIRAEYGWGLSLRWMKAKIEAKMGVAMGLRTLNERIHAFAEGVPLWQSRECKTFPPVVRVDGIWVTVMKRTGTTKKDCLGRMRAEKTGQRMAVLIAQGVWPATGRQEVLTWLIADGETQESWSDLLFQVRQMECRAVAKIELFIGDGSVGFEAARQRYYPEVPFQRCIFHKLRNVGRDLEVPAELDHPTNREYRKNILREAAAIWQAEHEQQAWQRFSAFCQKWISTQPKAVTTLQRDFELTLSFYSVQSQALARGERWPASLLRTTSQLERENRNFRRRIRLAVVFHSQTGLSAALFQNLMLRQALADPFLTAQWPRSIEIDLCRAKHFMS